MLFSRIFNGSALILVLSTLMFHINIAIGAPLRISEYGNAPLGRSLSQVIIHPVDNFNLTMAVNPTGGGTVYPVVGVHSYDEGTTVSVSAISEAGWRFNHWDGDVSDSSVISTTVIMDEDKTVTAVFDPNNPPVITEGETIVVVCCETFTLTLHATDLDGDILSWSIAEPPYHGTASVTGTGLSKEIQYTPPYRYSGYDLFSVMVTDGSDIDTIEINVNVAIENWGPQIVEGQSTSVSMSENGNPIPFDLTLHAIDMEDDPLTWSIQTQASHGIASVPGSGTSQVVTYTPNVDFEGADSFVVMVQDDYAGSETILVNVIIEPSFSSFLPLVLSR